MSWKRLKYRLRRLQQGVNRTQERVQEVVNREYRPLHDGPIRDMMLTVHPLRAAVERRATDARD